MTSIPTFSLPVRRAGSTTTTPGAHDRLWLPLGVVAAVVVALAGWLLLVAPQRDAATGLQARATAATAQADALQTRIATLRSQQADLPRYRTELEAAQAALPTTAALPVFLRTLQDLGTRTGTSVTALTATAPDATTGAAGTDPAGSAGVGRVYRVPVTVTVAGGYDGLTAFVTALQDDQPRAVLIDSVTESTADTGATTLTVAMTAFVAPTAGSGANGG